MPTVCFYVSGHGFGHASRQIEIINALGRRLPADWHVLLRSTAAVRLYERTLNVPFTLIPGETDTGVVQFDSLRLDETATVQRAGEFYRTFEDRARTDAALLGRHDTRLVICDAAPLACEAAAAAGVPSVVVSNFTWDWIYEGYAAEFARAAAHVLPALRRAYSRASAAWRLPMHGGFATVREIRDVPFVARRATRARDEVLSALRIAGDRPIVLSSFGGYGVGDLDLGTLDCLAEYTVVITRWQESEPPPGVACVDEWRMYEMGFRYEDLVGAADIVATKPGYGIISECIANDTAMLYTSRGHFVEYDVLVREMPRYVRCAFLDQPSVLGGRWRQALDALRAAPRRSERPRTDGAEVVATLVLERLGIAPA